MRSTPSFIRSSPLHHPCVTFAAVVLGPLAFALSAFDHPSRALIGITLAAVAGVALAFRPAAGARGGCGGMFFAGIVAFAAFLAMLVVSDHASAPWPIGHCYRLSGDRGSSVPAVALAIVLMGSLVFTRRAPRDLADADALVLALGTWLCLAGGAATSRAVAREPLVLRCSLSACPQFGLACAVAGDALGGDLACSCAVPLRPASEIFAGGVTLVGAALAAHAYARRRRRAVWLARARRQEIPGVSVVRDEGGTTLVLDPSEAGYRDAPPAGTRLPLETLRPRPSPPRHIAAYVIAVLALLAFAVPVGLYMWGMAGEAARIKSQTRDVPYLR
jgi:hypothetical protein